MASSTSATWLPFLILLPMLRDSLSQDNVAEVKNINFDLFALQYGGLSEVFLNLSSFLSDTKCATIVDNDVENSREDFERSLVGHLYKYYNLTLMYINTNMIEKFHGLYCSVQNETVGNFLCQTQLFFFIYETYDELALSMLDPSLSAIQETSQSLFVIVVKSENLESVTCQSEDFEMSLKTVTGDMFLKIWNLYKILEMYIYLPHLCGNQTVVRYDPIVRGAENVSSLGVKLLTREDILNDKNVMRHVYFKFNGYPLEVKLFTREPTLVSALPESFLSTYFRNDIADIGHRGGIDGFVLGNMAKALNFTARVSASAENIEYGWRASNGTFVGTIGDVISRRADVSFNGRFLKPYDTEDIEYTYPIYHDHFCVLVPKALRIPAWRNIFQGFSFDTWEVIVATACVGGVVWWLMKLWSPQPEPASRRRLACCFYFMDTNLLIAGQPMLLPTLGRERIFVAACLLFNIIFSSVFQGYLNTAFSTISHYPDINTLEALDDSGLPIGTSSRLDDIFGSNTSVVLNNLRKKVKRMKTPAIEEAAFKRDVSCVERSSDAELLIIMHYMAKDGEPLLHVVKECPRSYYITYIVYNGYPFLDHMDRFIRRISEAGLNNLWYDITVEALVLKEKFSLRYYPLKKLSLVDVQTGFFALMIGLVLAALALLCEVCYYYIGNRNKKLDSLNLFQPNICEPGARTPKYRFIT